MATPDPDDLILRALRGEGDPDDPTGRVGRALRGAVDDDVVVEPPPAGLWDRIEEVVAGDARVVPLDRARPPRRRAARWLAVAAAAVVVAVLATVGVVATRSGDAPSDVIARADLEPVDAVVAGWGEAQLVETGDGLALQVEVVDLDAPAGYLELWLASPDVSSLISLGPLRRDGRYELPPGFDPGANPVVDVSDEQLDGNPGHGGVSLLRGVLT
jgi:anti-sigma-K factor RskA